MGCQREGDKHIFLVRHLHLELSYLYSDFMVDLCMDVIQFIKCSIDGHLGSFQFFTIQIMPQWTSFVRASSGTCASISGG